MIILLLAIVHLAYAEVLVEVPISKNCSHVYSIKKVNVGNDEDYYRASLISCLEKGGQMISIDDAAELLQNYDVSETMSFFLTDTFRNRYIMMDFIKTIENGCEMDIVLRSPMKRVSHAVCLKKQNCTIWDEVLYENPIFLTVCGLLGTTLLSLVVSLCCCNKRRKKKKKKRAINTNLAT